MSIARSPWVLDKELSEAAFFPDYLLKMLAASTS